MADKKADLAGPGISTYPEVDKVLPSDYSSILMSKELNLMMVQCPLIMDMHAADYDDWVTETTSADAARCTDSMATSWCGTLSPIAVTS